MKMNEKILEIAAQAMHVEVENAAKHWREIPEHNCYYFWNPIKGGISVIINTNGEKLGAGSAVNFDRHLKAFLDGRRN